MIGDFTTTLAIFTVPPREQLELIAIVESTRAGAGALRVSRRKGTVPELTADYGRTIPCCSGVAPKFVDRSAVHRIDGVRLTSESICARHRRSRTRWAHVLAITHEGGAG
jgi:hypothetical protein